MLAVRQGEIKRGPVLGMSGSSAGFSGHSLGLEVWLGKCARTFTPSGTKEERGGSQERARTFEVTGNRGQRVSASVECEGGEGVETDAQGGRSSAGGGSARDQGRVICLGKVWG
ncbi:unnamed protein product [Prunus armeniaca]|uniref:Uncharacterized protein n=1 Tax=Prunus armeniaca TaxID=36596 RepID=A0A6J5VKT9_PRUAR|nr:unnamed protein product [Prunus armeniaca]